MHELIRKIFLRKDHREVLVFLTLLVRGELTMEDVPAELQSHFWAVSEKTVEFENPKAEEEAINELLSVALTQYGNADPRAIIERRFPEDDLTD